jgi:hypothetical protein
MVGFSELDALQEYFHFLRRITVKKIRSRTRRENDLVLLVVIDVTKRKYPKRSEVVLTASYVPASTPRGFLCSATK